MIASALPVSLNAAGDRLAVGAPRDDGPGGNTDYGAVYLFTFTDPSFSGGTLAAIVGKGYTGGRNVDVDSLQGWGTDRFDGSDGDQFGAAVSLNGAGTRLAVGAPGDEGAGEGRWPRNNYGAVYLFTFTNRSFSGGRLAAIMGEGYTGGRNVDVEALDRFDAFGASVSLNGAGNRLAVGAPKANSGEIGTVRLFTFTNRSFSGGRLAAIMGEGYTGGRNVDVAALDQYDQFGAAVSLNGAGNRLAVGAPRDDGAGHWLYQNSAETGAVYLFTFTDTSFSGGALVATMGYGYNDREHPCGRGLGGTTTSAVRWH